MADVVPGAASAVTTGLVECASGSDKLLVERDEPLFVPVS